VAHEAFVGHFDIDKLDRESQKLFSAIRGLSVVDQDLAMNDVRDDEAWMNLKVYTG
jgi:hypothetical protein